MSTAATPGNDNGSAARRADAEPRTERSASADRDAVVAREKEQFGGIKFGSAFFGWLTATGLAVLLLGILTGIGFGVSSSNADAADAAQKNASTASVLGVILLLVVILVSYYCGGYVAGRMARFSGLKQGLAVWLWAVIITIVLAAAGAIIGSQFDVLSQLGTIPTGSLSSSMTVGGIISLIAVAVIALVGALLGGLAGMRYHRKVDRAGFDAR